MFVVNSYTLAVVFCFVTMLCWGSWGNTQKLAGKTWRYELFYWDYVIGMVLFSLLIGLTMGSFGSEGRSFLEDLCSTFIATAFLNDKVCGYINIWVIAAFVVFEEIIAFVFCPVENKNKPIEKDKKAKFKAMGMIVFLLLDLFGGAIINKYQMVGSMILLTNLLIAVLIISAKIKEKRCDKNEII